MSLRHMLGIESSCDDTAAAVVREDGLVVRSIVASQLAEHGPFGGVVPELAARAHLRATLPVLQAALGTTGRPCDPPIDAIAVTQGPGLAGALIVGLQTAKTLAWAWQLPLLGVDHLQAHLLAAHLRRDEAAAPAPARPFIALLASGGHTALYCVEHDWTPRLLGQTRDDAAGECFDKGAKLLGLAYPGGPAVDRWAANGQPDRIKLPSPLAATEGYEFSFSGLKSALARRIEAHGRPADDASLADHCAALQAAIVEALVGKSLRACQALGVPRLVLSGGVAANRGLRAAAHAACQRLGVQLFVPEPAFCTDNAAMIAFAGHLRWQQHPLGDDANALAPYSRHPTRQRGRF